MIDSEFWARKNIGDKAVDYLKSHVHPLDLAFRLAEAHGVRIGGRVRYEFQMQTTYARNDDPTGTRGLGRIYADTRTATDYGLLRAFVRVDVARRNGAIYSGTATRIGNAFTGTSVDYNGNAQTQVVLDRAFIQFAA